MRSIVIAIALAAGCSLQGPLGDDGDDGDDDDGGDDDGIIFDAASPWACWLPPDMCRERNCITQVENFSYEDCCDSTQCNCNPATLEWEVWYCDPPLIDAPVDATPYDAAPVDAAPAPP